MKYFISHHQHKGTGISAALNQEGWRLSRRNVDIALFDHNINRANQQKGRPIVEKYRTEGATIISYPHGVTGNWWADSNEFASDNWVYANLVIGEGHKHVETIIQPHLRHYVIGWSYCPIKDFNKITKIKNILFAPIHGTMKRTSLREEAIEANTRVYEALLKIADRYQITVRHLNPLSEIGLHYTSKFQFKWEKPDGSYADIDKADLVIAEGTFMYLSVARGKPTIGINQRVPIRPNSNNKDFKLNNWNKYGNYMAYPIDFDDGDLQDLFLKASQEEQSEWRRLFIGNPLNSKKLSDLLINLRNEYIQEKGEIK